MTDSCIDARGEWAIAIYWEGDEKGPGMVAWAWNIPKQTYYCRRLGSSDKWAMVPGGPREAFFSYAGVWTQIKPGCPDVDRHQIWGFPRPSCDVAMGILTPRSNFSIDETTKPEATVNPEEPNYPFTARHPMISSTSVSISTNQLQAAMAPLARDVEHLRSEQEKSQSYIQWLEAEVNDLAETVTEQEGDTPAVSSEDLERIADVAFKAEAHSWSHLFRAFALFSLLVGGLVGAAYHPIVGAHAGMSCGVTLMALLQLMRAVSAHATTSRLDTLLESNDCIRVGYQGNRSVRKA